MTTQWLSSSSFQINVTNQSHCDYIQFFFCQANDIICVKRGLQRANQWWTQCFYWELLAKRWAHLNSKRLQLCECKCERVYLPWEANKTTFKTILKHLRFTYFRQWNLAVIKMENHATLMCHIGNVKLWPEFDYFSIIRDRLSWLGILIMIKQLN